ncbi:MAG: DUF1365 domain-containing protein [Verrucomicrobiaceae bacterium]|nr:MAG: DUF1365 domain-containing protein [Verrucomicrobiaceae bacterium]
MKDSCLYECTVMHRRLSPKKHEFVYRIFLFFLDLDEVDHLGIPIFSTNSPNVYALHDSDYFRLGGGSIRDNLLTFLRSEGVTEMPARIRLLTLPRLLGYTFNPISVFFCFDSENRPLTSVVQVGNTFGEFKPFVVPLDPESPLFHARLPKHFYVSPFSALDLEFDFRFDFPGEHLRILIDDYQGAEKTLISTLTGSRRELTLGSLLFLSIKYPLVTLKIITLIHWEAFRLWWKRIPHHDKESDPHLQTGVFRARK